MPSMSIWGPNIKKKKKKKNVSKTCDSLKIGGTLILFLFKKNYYKIYYTPCPRCLSRDPIYIKKKVSKTCDSLEIGGTLILFLFKKNIIKYITLHALDVYLGTQYIKKKSQQNL